jgi:hypothetical protein
MPKLKRLQDVYRFPGFTPLAAVRGIFGNPMAVVVSLRRRRKKHGAVFAVKGIAPSTTNVPGWSAISLVATNEFSLHSRFVAFAVSGVMA